MLVVTNLWNTIMNLVPNFKAREITLSLSDNILLVKSFLI